MVLSLNGCVDRVSSIRRDHGGELGTCQLGFGFPVVTAM